MKTPFLPDLSTTPLTEDELKTAMSFADALIQENEPISKTDLFTIRLAVIEYVKALRLQNKELSTDRIQTQMRDHPISLLLRLLQTLNATRQQKMTARSLSNTVEFNGELVDENELRTALLSIGDKNETNTRRNHR